MTILTKSSEIYLKNLKKIRNLHNNMQFSGFFIFQNFEKLKSFLNKFEAKSAEDTVKQEKNIAQNSHNLNEYSDEYPEVLKFGDLTLQILHIFSIVPSIFSKFPINLLEKADELKEEGIISLDFNYPAYLALNDVVNSLELPLLRNSLLKPSGKGVKIAILDSGVDTTHPYLRNSVIKHYNITEEDGEHEQDLNGHGTIISGIICGRIPKQSRKLNDKNGQINQITEGFYGIAPESSLIDIKITDQYGKLFTADILMGLELCYRERDNIDLILISATTPHVKYADDILSQACEKLSNEGLICVAPAGNFGPESDTIGSPGISPYVLCVGATTKDRDVVFFSSRGSNKYRSSIIDEKTQAKKQSYSGEQSNSRLQQNIGKQIQSKEQNQSENILKSDRQNFYNQIIKPDVVMPGSKICTIFSPNSLMAGDLKLKNNKDVGLQYSDSSKNSKLLSSFSGTSIAAAIFIGIIALMKEIEPSLNLQRIKYYISKFSRNLYQNRNSQGWGEFDFIALLSALNLIITPPESYGIKVKKASILTSAFILILIALFLII